MASTDKSADKAVSITVTNNTILRVIVWGVFVLVIWKLWSLVLILMTSIVLASFIHAVAAKLSSVARIPRTLSVVFMYVLSIGAIAAVFYFFIPILLKETVSIFNLLSNYVPPEKLPGAPTGTELESASTFVNAISEQGSSFGDVLTQSQGLISKLSGGFFSVISSAFGGILNIILIIILSFYLSI